MRNILLILTLLLTGGCVADNSPGPNVDNGAKPSRTRGDDSDDDKRKPLCVDTIEGTEGKKICY